MLIMTTKVDKRKLIIAAAAVIAAIVMLLTLGGGASEPTASMSTAPAADTNDGVTACSLTSIFDTIDFVLAAFAVEYFVNQFHFALAFCDLAFYSASAGCTGQ